ncbi:MAG TPA: hypothetical protein VG272_09900 [Candidatus Acidoferrales bacterium]|nr:hypothetical protein [Candidatus Acidoferrales bacterium]
MRNCSVVLLSAACILVLPPAISAQAKPPAAPAKTHSASAKPDLSGVWFIDEYHRNLLPNEDPPFQPWAKDLFKKRQEESANRTPDSGPDPTEKCIPPGTPREMFQPFPWEIVYARDRILMLFEYQGLIRQIFTDGRGHPKDLEPTYMGHSIGKFEGNTLVVDTIGFNDKTWLDPMGLPHSDAMHLTERIRRVNHDTLVDEYTIDDPKAYTKPWKAQRTFVLKPDWQIQEYVCAENNNVK